MYISGDPLPPPLKRRRLWIRVIANGWLPHMTETGHA